MTATLLKPTTVRHVTSQPAITIVVVPQERFSYTQQSLESIYRHTHCPFNLIYVDAGSPRRIQKYLTREATKRGFTLLRSEQFLAPNQARNLGLSQVSTEYVVFVDNDIHVAPGWLDQLWRCAKETNAAVVSPLTCVGQPLHDRIQSAGGEVRIFMDVKGKQIRRCLYEKRFLVNRSAAGIKDQLYRRGCEFATLDCLLVKRDIFDRLGPLDEKLLGAQEDADFCLGVNRLGGQMFCEPTALVTHVPQTSYRWSDMAYFMLRWSDTWEVESLMYFQQKWDLDMDQYFLDRYRQLGHRRHNRFIYPLLDQVMGDRNLPWLEKLAIGLERWFNQVIADRHARLSDNITIKKISQTPVAKTTKQRPQRQAASLSQPRLMLH